MKNIFSLLCLLLFADVLYAQVYPVQATVQLTPPYSLYLTDYVESGSERLALNIFLSDMARPDLNVRFRLKIIGQGITMETKPSYIPPPVSIQSGVPLRLISTDLADYFNPNNLTFQGMSQRQYEQRGKLPEGVYQFCFEVLEYNRGLKISNTGCATAWLVLNDPPMVNVPGQDTKLKVLSPQNVVLQWTPRHTGSPNSAFTTEYEIKMVEVWPATRNPNDAILTSPPILEETTRNTTFIYGPAETPLEPGRRYAFRIRAKSISGIDELDLFKNNGYSEVFSFVYGDACDLPTGISTESISSARVSLKWEPLFNHTAFKVRYRQAGTTNWYYNNVTLPSAQFTSLKPNTTYEYQVEATCGVFDGAYSSISRVTTAEEPQIDYSCGVPITPFNLDPAELTGSLKPGDVIRAGDFDVKLVSVNGSNGVFTGEGVIEVPYFNKAKVKTSFTSITVNKELRMVNGFMNVTGAGVDIIPQGVMDAMEELSETLDVLDSALTTIEENLPVQTDWTSFVPDSVITMTGEIVDVSKNENGSVTVTDSKGNTQTLPSGTNYAVKDEKGNGYLVDKNGNVHKTTSDVVTKLANREYNLVLKFSEDPASKYGFDQNKFNPPADTEVLKDGYRVAWKSVASGAGDPVIANLGVSGIDKSKIHFELGGIPVQAPPMSTGTTTRISIAGGSDGSFEDLLALYTPSDTGKVQVLGKLKVASYDKISRSVVIVPVNNVALPAGLTVKIIEDSLNAIYGQAVVDWKVRIVPPIEASVDDPFDDGESGLLSNYTADMKKVIKAFGKLEDETYYLFLVKNPKSGNALGYMPRGKQSGFIFADKHGNKEELVRTMAHELGHGAFHLHHTFKEPNFTLAEGKTDNLMDYPAGNKLYKYQWDKMRYPDIVVGVFEEDEEGENIVVYSLPEKLKNDDKYFSFITPAADRIILEDKKLKAPVFFHGIPIMDLAEVVTGTLIGFSYRSDESQPYVKYSAKIKNGIFEGYYKDNQAFEYKKPDGIKENAMIMAIPHGFASEFGNIYKYRVIKFSNAHLKDYAPLHKIAAEQDFPRIFLEIPQESYDDQDPKNIIGDAQISVSTAEYSMITGIRIPYVPNISIGKIPSKYAVELGNHNDKPEILAMLKIAQWANMYPDYYDEFDINYLAKNPLSLVSCDIGCALEKLAKLREFLLAKHQQHQQFIKQLNTSTSSADEIAKVLSNFSESDFYDITVKKRIEIIKKLIASAEDLPDEKELIIVKLTKFVYAYKVDSLLSEYEKDGLIIKVIEGEEDAFIGLIGGNNYTSFIQAIVGDIKRSETFELRLKSFIEDEDFVDRQVIWKNFNSSTILSLPYGYTSVKKESIRISASAKVSYDVQYLHAINDLGFEMGFSSVGRYFPDWRHKNSVTDLSPFDLIVFVNQTNVNLIDEGGDTPRGEVAIVPAIFLKYVLDKEFNDNALTTAAILVDFATLASGPGAIAKTATRLRRAWVIFEMSNAAGNLALNSFGEDLKGTEFAHLVELSNKVMLVYGLGKLGKGSVRTIDEAIEIARTVTPKLSKDLANQFLAAVISVKSRLLDISATSKSAESILILESRLSKIFLNEGINYIYSIRNGITSIKYGGYGGDIMGLMTKTTTVIGKWKDEITGYGTKWILNLPEGVFTRGKQNLGGVNILDIPSGEYNALLTKNIDKYKALGHADEIAKKLSREEGLEEFWVKYNFPFLEDAFKRGDRIRLLSDFTDARNLNGFYKREIEAILGSVKNGVKEAGLAEKYGYKFNQASFSFEKP